MLTIIITVYVCYLNVGSVVLEDYTRKRHKMLSYLELFLCKGFYRNAL